MYMYAHVHAYMHTNACVQVCVCVRVYICAHNCANPKLTCIFFSGSPLCLEVEGGSLNSLSNPRDGPLVSVSWNYIRLLHMSYCYADSGESKYLPFCLCIKCFTH